jgi:MoxR-like ATPase
MSTPEQQITRATGELQRLRAALASVIVGQDRLIEDLLIAVAAGGHVLMEGLPGLGKTHLAKGLANALGLGLGRVQCTPDLMPADITGSEFLDRDNSGSGVMSFRKGPIFANLVLVDEINRATPKTQAALLEAMQEGQVTYGGRTHPLPRPFWVIATQNPIEIEGTYPLPEAQLDRFLVKLTVPFPDAHAMLRLLEISLDNEPSETLRPELEPEALNAMMTAAGQVLIAEPVRQSAVELILATHPDPSRDATGRGRLIRYGASPRGLQALLRTARVHALLAGRAHVAIGDLERMALPVLRHRVLPTIESELAGTEMDQVLSDLLREWRDRQ